MNEIKLFFLQSRQLPLFVRTVLLSVYAYQAECRVTFVRDLFCSRLPGWTLETYQPVILYFIDGEHSHSYDSLRSTADKKNLVALMGC